MWEGEIENKKNFRLEPQLKLMEDDRQGFPYKQYLPQDNGS
jgi:hypothetical protein